jgi:hypothetical protein
MSDEGLPPFPAGKRETEQHREWMTLYKAHRRLADRGPSTAELERRQELLRHQHGRCPVCRKPLDLGDSCLDDATSQGNAQGREPAVLHASCRELVTLARSLGAEALDRVKERL